MANIDFSKEGIALLNNTSLSSHLINRMSQLTDAEKHKGIVEIDVTDGEENYTLEFRFGPEKNATHQPIKSKKPSLQPS